jgi:hypothetical protein
MQLTTKLLVFGKKTWRGARFLIFPRWNVETARVESPKIFFGARVPMAERSEG